MIRKAELLSAAVLAPLIWPCPAKTMPSSMRKCADSHHLAHAQSLIQAFASH